MGRELCGMFTTAVYYCTAADNSRIGRESSLREIAGFCTLFGFGTNHAAESMPPLQAFAMRLCGEAKKLACVYLQYHIAGHNP